MKNVLPVQPRDWLIVPSEAHVETNRILGFDSFTLRRLVQEQAELEFADRAATTPESSRLLLAKLRGLSASVAHDLDQTVGKLRRAGTSIRSLEATRLPRGGYFAELLQDLDDALNRRLLYDDRSSPWAAARRLAQVQEHPQLPNGAALVRGLAGWDNATLAVLESLDHRLRKMGQEGLYLELPESDDGPLGEAVSGLATELETRWSDRQHSPSLKFVKTAPVDRTRVDCIEAYDAESEARAVARTVVEALARGESIDRVAIVPVRLEEAFLEPLRFELARAKIPFAEPRGRPAIASPRAHAALSLLRLARGPLGRDALLDVLRVPELQNSRWFSDAPGELGELLHEISLLPLRYDRTGHDLRDELDDHLAKLSQEDSERAGALAGAKDHLFDWIDRLKRLSGPSPRHTLIGELGQLFESVGLAHLSEPTLRRALQTSDSGDSGLLRALGHDAAGARAVIMALERMSDASRAIGAETDLADVGSLLEELELSLQGISPTRGAVRTGALRIARPSEIAGLDFDSVVLCRTQGMRPPGGPSNTGLGADLEARLAAAERPQSPGAEHRFEALAVLWSLACARRATVTWASHEEARPLAPSRLTRWLLDRDLSCRREPSSPLLPGARLAHLPEKPSAWAEHRIATEQNRARFFADPSAPVDPYNGQAGTLAPFFSADADRPLGVTTLERSLRCPFLGFTSQVLRATLADPIEDAISARERGSLLHEALAQGLSAVRELWGLRGPKELARIALEHAQALLEQRGRSPLRRAGLKSTLGDVASLLRHIFEADDGYRFVFSEQSFGKNASWQPLRIGETFLAGRVDRIDLGDHGKRLRVIDYKTRLPSLAEQERALQPALYGLKAAVELGAEQVEFVFLALQGRTPRARTVFATTPDGEPIREGAQRALSVLKTLKAGSVPPRPASSSDCVRCTARDICRRPLSAPESLET